MKYMIYTVKFTCFLICCQIPGILNHHDSAVISFGIGADRTKLLVSQRVTALTVLNILPCIGNGGGQLLYLVLRHIHDMKCKTLGRFGSDSRKMGKLLDQLIDMTAVVFHQNGRPPPSPPRPPVSLDITAVDSSSTLRSASFVAATMRSSSISMSSGSTTSS